MKCSLTLLGWFLSLVGLAGVVAAKSPNVILILADDMAVGDLASINGGLSRTPHLDELRRSSVWFRQAYSASPVCAPARAALLTGRYPHRTGVVSLNMETRPALTSLSLDETTMADRFRQAGYATGLIGKWHLGAEPAYHPLRRGFDEFEGFIGHLYVPSYFDYRLDIQDQTRPFPDRYLTTDLSARAVEFVRRHQDEPFFLHLAHYAPHRPLDAPEERIEPYVKRGLDRDTATVYAMIEIMDEGIGDLMRELDHLQLRDHTLVIFASDNGPDSLVQGRFNDHLRGTKYMVHEGGIRVPLMVNWPARFSPSERDEPVHFTDVLPTLIELCDLPTATKHPLDGTSFARALAGQSCELPPQRFWQWNRNLPLYSHNAAVRQGEWKLVRPFITKNDPKGESNRAAALYRMSDDPSESRDLSGEYPELAQRLDAALSAWADAVERDRTRATADHTAK